MLDSLAPANSIQSEQLAPDELNRSASRAPIQARAETFSQLLTRANEPELRSQAGSAYRVVKQRKLAHPTRFDRVTFAFGGRGSLRNVSRSIGTLIPVASPQ